MDRERLGRLALEARKTLTRPIPILPWEPPF